MWCASSHPEAGTLASVTNVWLKSRVPGASARIPNHSVDRSGGSYADIVRAGRRFRFSHEAVMRDEEGLQVMWLVYIDVGRAG